MSGYQGRERPWDIELDDIPLIVVRDNQGRPQWTVEAVPAIAGHTPGVIDEEQVWRSWHAGFGYAYVIASDTYHYASNLDLRFPRQMIMGPAVTSFAASGNVVGFFEQSSILYVLASRYCQQVDTTNDDCETPDDAALGKDLGSGKAATAALPFDGNTLIATGTGDQFWIFTGTTWTKATDSRSGDDLSGAYVASVWADTYYAIGRTFLSSSDPAICWASQGAALGTAANWSSIYDVGEDGRAITGLTARDQSFFIAKTDGLYMCDKSGRTPRVLPMYTINANNGVNTIVDQSGYIWYPAVDGYYRYDSHTGSVVDCSPGRGLPNASSIYGRVTAHVQHKGWRYVSVYNGTTSYIMCGREREEGEAGIGPMIWHGALYSVTGQITCMHITSLTTPPRLYFGVTTNVYYFRLPAAGDNPLLDSNYRYATSGSLYMPADEWGSYGLRRSLSGFEIENEGFSATTYADLLIQMDNGAWQTVYRAKVAGRSIVTIPAVGSWRFTRLAWRLDITNGSNTSTPTIRAVVGKAVRRVPIRDLIHTTVYCSDRAQSRLNLQTRLSGPDTVSRVKNLGLDDPVTLSDWWTGSQRNRRVVVGPVQEVIVKQQGDDSAEQAVTLLLRQVGSSFDTAYYGTGVYHTSRYS